MGNQNCRICELNPQNYPDQHQQGLSPQIETLLDSYRKKHIKNIQLIEQKKLPNGIIFRGIMKDGKKHGYGQYFYGKNIFVGNFNQDIPEGQGLLIRSLTDFFEGNFKKGKPHGEGKEKLGNIRFQGVFENGQRVQGTLTTDLYTYKGGFKDEKFQGRGQIEFKSGEKYEGTFKKGKYHGNGVFKHKDKEEYRGEFKNGEYEGVGKYSWDDGSQYNGEYTANKRCGYGTFKKENYQWTGAWEYGKRKEKNKFEEEPLVI